MSTLELMLRDAGTAMDWPQTPPLAAAVAARIDAQAAPGAAATGAGAARLGARAVRDTHRRAAATRASAAFWRVRVHRPLAIALAALLLMAAVAAAVPGIRDPVLDWLGVSGVEIERVPRTLPPAAGARLELGERTTLAAARRELDFAPLLPSGLGEPAVWYDPAIAGGQLGLVYRDGRLFLTEYLGTLERRYLFKFVGPDARVERVLVDGQRGVWITGAPHDFGYADRYGELRVDSIRLAGDVLLWRDGDVLLRLEGARSKAEALRVARSARATP